MSELFKQSEKKNGCGLITNGYKLVFVDMIKRVLKFKLKSAFDFDKMGFYLVPFH